MSVEQQLITLNHIKDGNKKFYTLHAVIVMPDHVHMILEPLPGYSLSRIMKGIKGASARKINKARNSYGSIWQDESFDRIIRDEKEYNEKMIYMFENPLRAGLTEKPEDYHGWYQNDNI
jgi:putative transposase